MTQVPPAERPAILDELVLRTGGYPEAELDRVVWLESRWDPAAQNPKSRATGLIQFLPSHIKRWGYTLGEVQAMTAMDQAALVGRYFRDAMAFGRYQYPGDTYLAVAAPAFIGRSDTAVAYPVGSPGWRDNPAWRSAGDGPVTVGSIRAVLLRGMKPKPEGRGAPKGPPRVEPGGGYYPVNPRTPAKTLPWGMVLGLVLVAVASEGERSNQRR